MTDVAKRIKVRVTVEQAQAILGVLGDLEDSFYLHDLIASANRRFMIVDEAASNVRIARFDYGPVVPKGSWVLRLERVKK